MQKSPFKKQLGDFRDKTQKNKLLQIEFNSLG